MGRIKTQLVKRISKELFAKYPDQYKPDFTETKLLIAKHAEFPSKKLRNTVAGYITRLVRQNK